MRCENNNMKDSPEIYLTEMEIEIMSLFVDKRILDDEKVVLILRALIKKLSS